uniref:Uncharacterized protein n=1 Tax=Avena sativa TaxID=4498 RepID=A0ACD5XL69_AVESA
MLIALLFCFVPAVTIYSYTRRSRAEANFHRISDAVVAHQTLVQNADDLLNRPAAIFPVSLATWRDGQRNDNITTADHGPHWRALRHNLTAALLHPSRLGSHDPLHHEAAQALIADLSARGSQGAEVIIRGPISTALFALATRLCFGDLMDGSQRRVMGRVVRDSMAAVAALNPVFDGSALSKLVNWRGFRRISALMDRQAELYLPLIEARRQLSQSGRHRDQALGRTYVDSLLDLRVPVDGDAIGAAGRRALRDGEIVALVFEFLGAATGSAATCVEWTLAHLIDQPEVLEKLRNEIHEKVSGTGGATTLSSSILSGMPYLDAVVIESLRMHPPVPLTLRSAHDEGAKAVGATTVPASGLRVLFSLGDIGRDNRSWTDPDEFRPERFLPGGEAEDVGPLPGRKRIRMMPFGAGHRYCPGVAMGMLHIKCFLAALVHEFEWAPSPEECSGSVDSAFLRVMKKPLRARFTRRT